MSVSEDTRGSDLLPGEGPGYVEEGAGGSWSGRCPGRGERTVKRGAEKQQGCGCVCVWSVCVIYVCVCRVCGICVFIFV